MENSSRRLEVPDNSKGVEFIKYLPIVTLLGVVALGSCQKVSSVLDDYVNPVDVPKVLQHKFSSKNYKRILSEFTEQEREELAEFLHNLKPSVRVDGLDEAKRIYFVDLENSNIYLVGVDGLKKLKDLLI